MTACITGWAHTCFGRLDGEDSESLIVRVVREAIADANLEAKDIDAIYLVLGRKKSFINYIKMIY